MGNHFDSALEDTEAQQAAYGRQLGFIEGRTPFAAETIPDQSVAVEVNEDLMQEVASHIVNRAGHISIIDEPGAGKSHFRDMVYESLRDRQERFRVARIKEVESITTRRTYTRLLDELRPHADLEIPESLPQATDAVRAVVEDVGDQLEAQDLTCIVQVDQLEDVATTTRRFEQLLAALQSIGDLGESEPVFVLFLFGTTEAAERITDLRETLSSRLVAENRSLERFGFAETDELIARWLAWARDESYDESYPSDPFAPSAVQHIADTTSGLPREARQECYQAFRRGAKQYAADGTVEITEATLETYV